MLLLRSKSRSESVNKGRCALQLIWCCDANWCCCIIQFIVIGARWLTAAGHILPRHGAFSLISLLGTLLVLHGFLSIPFHHFHIFLVELFSVVRFQEWMALDSIWKLTKKSIFEVSPRGKLTMLRAAKSPSDRYICCTSTSLLHVSCLLFTF